MELLDLSGDPLGLPLLPPAGAGPGLPAAKPSALKAGSLSRLGELQQYLRQCEDQKYLKHYIKVLSAMPRDLLDDLAKQIKARSAWLSAEEQREYKRAKVLNVMGAPCSPRHSAGCAGGAGAGAGLAGSPLCAAAGGSHSEADAFCSQVLEGSGGSGAAADLAAADLAVGGDMQLERLDLGLEQQPFMTPPDAPRTKMRMLPPPAAGGGQDQQERQQQQQQQPGRAEAEAAAAAAAAGDLGSSGGRASGDDASPPGPLPTGVTDHQLARISPPDAHDAAGSQQQLLRQRRQGGGSGRARQAKLLPDK